MKRLLLLSALLTLTGCDRPSSPAALERLQAAAQAEQSVAWSGTLRLTTGASSAEVAVEYDGQGRARRRHLAGPCQGLEVITVGHAEWQRRGQGTWTQRGVLAPAGLRAGDEELRRIAAGYEVRLSAGQPIAGRASQQLDLLPRRRGNPSRRLWLDAKTAVILRAEQRNHRGKLLAVTEVVAADLGARPTIAPPASSVASREYPFVDLTRLADAADLSMVTGETITLPTRLPAGYALDGCFARSARSGRVRPVFTFSDGLNVVTVFDRGLGRGHQYRGGGRLPCTIASGDQANVVTVRRERREWIAIGDLDQRQLRRLAEAMP